MGVLKFIGGLIVLLVAVTAATLGVVGFMWFLVVILHADRCSMTAQQKAIAIIEECRQIHVDWANSSPAWRRKKVTRNQSGGGVRHHLKWVKNYDLVLEVLRGHG